MTNDQIKAYMREELIHNVSFYDTFDCGDIDMTKLAEDTAQHFDLYGQKAAIPETIADAIVIAVLFELAFEVVSERMEEISSRC